MFLVDILKYLFGLAELAAAFVIQSEVIQPIEQRVVDRALAVFFKCLVKMTL